MKSELEMPPQAVLFVKDSLPVKFRANHLVPVAISMLMPLIAYYANAEKIEPVMDSLLLGWLIMSASLYTTWQGLRVFWRIQFPDQPLKQTLIRVLFVLSILAVAYFIFGFVDKGDRLTMFIRFAMACLLFIVIQYALKSQEKVLRLQVENQQTQSEMYRFQLSAIRARIDPHFLFNTLNVLRSMVRQGNPNSEDFVVSLSQFYRQTLSYTDESRITLKQELEILNSYLFLMGNRNENAFEVRITVDPSLKDMFIPPLSLQLAVENCFKHNAMSPSKPLRITIEGTDRNTVTVQNNVQPKFNAGESPGFGLKSLRDRYKLMHIHEGVEVTSDNEHFTLELKLIIS